MKDVLITSVALLGGIAVLYAVWFAGGRAALAGTGGIMLLLYSWRLSLIGSDTKGDDG